MKTISILFSLLVPAGLLAQNQNLNPRAFEALCQHFHTYVDEGVLPGTLIYIEKEGVLNKDVYGFQDIARGIPMSESSIFRWASMTKPITATAIMMLVEAGKLQLDDAVSLYLPEVTNMSVYQGDSRVGNIMTIRHLLSHTSGITSGFDRSAAGQAAAKQLAQARVHNLKELVAAVCSTQLAFEPGKGWAYGYSNDLLACIIERVSGMPVEQFFKQHIFEPLEMKHTAFQVKEVDALTSVYAPNEAGELLAVETAANSRYVNGQNFARGNGGLAGPASDYLNFCRMLLKGGTFRGRRLLSPESVRAMMHNEVGEEWLPLKILNTSLTGQGYGLGLGVLMPDAPFGHAGDVFWPGALYTYFFINTQQQTIGIFMTQMRDMSRMSMMGEFHDLATKACEEQTKR
ncbi:MAG: class A beta-lactamase-related serine hydrolase [Bacteroidetes bacterium]|nr:MAG: class A beta-lactamase-related serine hydrolase [Bacteroidota bacterium]